MNHDHPTGGAAALDSIANNAAPSPSERDAERLERKGIFLREKWLQRNYMRRVLRGTRCATCGRIATAGTGVGLYWDEQHGARYSGLLSCGSVWCCPVCNAKIQAQRMIEIRTALQWARDNDLSVVFATHTVRHNKRQSLKDVRDMAANVWRKCRAHAPVKKLFKKFGSKGYTRATEVTWSKANGWHVHYHSFYFLRPDMSEAEVQAFGAAYSANWCKTAKDNGYQAPTEENQRFELVDLRDPQSLDAAAAYLTQFKTANLKSAAHELTDTQAKFGKIVEHNGQQILHLSYWDMLRAFTDLSRQKAQKTGRHPRIPYRAVSYIIGYFGISGKEALTSLYCLIRCSPGVCYCGRFIPSVQHTGHDDFSA